MCSDFTSANLSIRPPSSISARPELPIFCGAASRRARQLGIEGGAISSGAITSNGAVSCTTHPGASPASSDFNGDHKADIVWRNSSGLLADWFMNGPVIGASGFLSVNGTPVNPTRARSIAGIGDLERRRHLGPLWRDTSGLTAVWVMNGSSIIGSDYLKVNGTIISPTRAGVLSAWAISTATNIPT